MNVVSAVIRDGIRVTFLRRPLGNPALAGGGAFLASLIFYLLTAILTSVLQTNAPWVFFGWGLNTALADATLTLIAAWLLVRMSGRFAITWGVAAIALAATAATSALVQWPLQSMAHVLYRDGGDLAPMALTWLSQIWWLFVLIALSRWLLPRRLPLAILASLIAFAISAMPWSWMPGAPMVVQEHFGGPQGKRPAQGLVSDAVVDARFNDDLESDTIDFDPEQLMFDQPRLLDSAIAALRPRTPGKTNLYVVAFGGGGGENVFRNEVEYAERLFGERFDARGHVIVLENNPASVDTRPLATLTNLRFALQGIATRMDATEDILLVYLTSHGSNDHLLYVALDPLPLNQIDPQDLAEALQTSPAMRWKVIVVNACYSGGFIDTLRDDSTMVISSARGDRTSFGCGAESDITYFGNAFLSEALNETHSIPKAFAKARDTVAAWEKRDSMNPPSEPQIAGSRSMEAKLEKWSRSLPPSASIPFTPADDKPAADAK
jgi:hypothetical protein